MGRYRFNISCLLPAMRLWSVNAAMFVAVAASRLRRCENTVVFAMSLTFASLRSPFVAFVAGCVDLNRTFYQVGVFPTCFQSSDRSYSTRWERFRRAKLEDIGFFRASLGTGAQNSATLHRLLPSDIALYVFARSLCSPRSDDDRVGSAPCAIVRGLRQRAVPCARPELALRPHSVRAGRSNTVSG